MIIAIGCDVVEHDLTQKLNWENNISIQNRIFSSKELEIYFSQKDIKFLAGRFAAKEAVLKCLSTGMLDGISLTDIHVLKSNIGMPIIELTGKIKELSSSIGINKWHISISHTSNLSMAIALAES